MNTVQIEAKKVEESGRLAILPKYLGPALMMKFEARLYSYMGYLSKDYDGGYWEFYELDNGGFYMAPTSPERMHISVDTNGYEGLMSADAAGVTACLFTLSALGFHERTEAVCDLYLKLQEFASQHIEASAIFRAID